MSLVRCIDRGCSMKPSARETCSGLPDPLLSQRSFMPIVQQVGDRSISHRSEISTLRS